MIPIQVRPDIAASEKGMTLIEVLVSFTIIAMLVMSFYSIFTQSVKQTADEQYTDQALTIGRSIMDGVKQQIFKSNQVTLFGQTLDVTNWKCDALGKLPSGESCTPELEPAALFYPSIENPQFKITLKLTRTEGNVALTLPKPEPLSAIPASPAASNLEASENVQLILGDYFRRLTVSITDPTGRSHTYENLITVK